jgi:hypothetical protein
LQHFQVLRHRVSAESAALREGGVLRDKVDKAAADLRGLNATARMRSPDAAHPVTIEAQVNHVVDRLRRASLDSVSVVRDDGGSDDRNVTLRVSFVGSFDNVGIFLAGLHADSDTGLGLVSVAISRDAISIADYVSVRLVLSVRSISQATLTCAQRSSS